VKLASRWSTFISSRRRAFLWLDNPAKVQGMPVIVLSDSFEISLLPLQDTSVLAEPSGETGLLADMNPFAAKKAAW
jgi:hypothetical protein